MEQTMTKQAAPRTAWQAQRENLIRQAGRRNEQQLARQKADYARGRRAETAGWQQLAARKEPDPMQQLRASSRSGGAYAPLPSAHDVAAGRARLALPRLSEHDDDYMNKWLGVYNQAYDQNVTLDQLKQRLADAYRGGRQDFRQVQEQSRRGWYNPARWTWLGGHRYDLSQQAQKLNEMQNRAVADPRSDPLAYAEAIERQNALSGKSSTYMSAKPYRQVALGSGTTGQQLLRQGEDWGRRGEAMQYVNGRLINGLTLGLGGSLTTGIGNKLWGQGWKNIDSLYGDYVNSAKKEFGDLYGEQAARRVRWAGLGAEAAGTILSSLALGGMGGKSVSSLLHPRSLWSASRAGGIHAMKPASLLGRTGHRFLTSATTMRPLEHIFEAGANATEGSSPGWSTVFRIGQNIAHSQPYWSAGGTLVSGMLGKMLPSMYGAQTAGATAQTAGATAQGASWFRRLMKPGVAAARFVARNAKNNLPEALGYIAGDTASALAEGRKPELGMDTVKSSTPFLLFGGYGPAGQFAWQMGKPMLAKHFTPFAVWAGAQQEDENGRPVKDTFSQLVEKDFNAMMDNPVARANFLKSNGMSQDSSPEDIRKAYNRDWAEKRQAHAELYAKLSLLPAGTVANIRTQEDLEAMAPQLDAMWKALPQEKRRKALAKEYRSQVMAGGPLPDAAFSSEELSAQDREDNLAIALGVADKEAAGTGVMRQLWDVTAGDDQNIALRAMDASPEARSAVISYAGGLIRDAVNGKLDASAAGDAQARYSAVLDKMTPEERTRMFDTLLLDPKTTGKKLADIMRNANAYGIDNPELRKAAVRAVAEHMTAGYTGNKQSGFQASGDFAAEFIPEFTAMLQNGQGLDADDKRMFAETLAELPAEAAGNLFFTADDDNFKKLARLFMSEEGQGMLDSLPEEKRNAIKAQWENAARARTMKAIQDNPVKNLPLAARLFAEKMGWGGDAADFLGSPGGFYGTLALLLLGGIWLGRGLLSGREEPQQGQGLMDALNAQRAQQARMTFGGMNG